MYFSVFPIEPSCKTLLEVPTLRRLYILARTDGLDLYHLYDEVHTLLSLALIVFEDRLSWSWHHSMREPTLEVPLLDMAAFAAVDCQLQFDKDDVLD